jgi:hypothetical protein
MLNGQPALVPHAAYAMGEHGQSGEYLHLDSGLIRKGPLRLPVPEKSAVRTVWNPICEPEILRVSALNNRVKTRFLLEANNYDAFSPVPEIEKLVILK